MKRNDKVVHVVHCIDTEGPLHEPLSATFERIESLFGIKIEPTSENLLKLQNREIPLNGFEDAVQRLANPHLLTYNDTWDKIDSMLGRLLSKSYRQSFPDSFRGGWIYNWFCLDHVGFTANPRRRDMGYHRIFDHYREMLNLTESHLDGLQFHFHPVPFSKSAHHCATHYFAHSDALFQILGRRIIDRHWFPSAYRPGFHTIRPDSHWFLEQYIPFDFSNQSITENSDQPDMTGGRYGDWRHAPQTWEPYHPDHDDYQKKGRCRRLTARCLNMRTRMRCINQEETDKAFAEATQDRPVVLSFTNHDFRDMHTEVVDVYAMLKSASARYPEVKFRYCEASEAMRSAMRMNPVEAFSFKMEFVSNCLHIAATDPIFGPQPFFVVKTRSGEYFHDNLDFQKPFRQWSYEFDVQNFNLDAISKIGVAANDKFGNTTITVIDMDNNRSVKTNHLRGVTYS